MYDLFVLLALIVLAIPCSIGYLFVRLNSTQKQLVQFKKKIDELLQVTKIQSSQIKQLQEQGGSNIPKKSLLEENSLQEDRLSKETLEQKNQQNLEQTAHLQTSPVDVPISASAIDSSTSPSNIAASNETHTDTIKAASRTPIQRTKSTKREQKPIVPDLFDRGIALVKRYFTEGNIIVRVGVLVLFVGVAFLLKYASDNSMIPIELRVIGVALTGIAILTVGWKLRISRADYALVMQGAGIGILYLTAFASLKLFHLLPAGFVLICLLIMVILSTALAVLQDSRALAVLAVSGGFLAPVLTSSGDGSHIALFSFYTILNIGIFCIAWFKSWRLLNLVGFVFTFVIGSAWGFTSYTPDIFISTEFFLIVFFLMYVAISILFSYKQEPKLKGYVDGTLVFGLPLIASSLQATLVYPYAFALAYSSFILGVFYISLAWVFQRGWGRFKPDPKLQVLSEAFLALGFVFASLTIPFALDGEWIASAWALEGAAILWISIKQQRIIGLYFSLILQVLGGFAFIETTDGTLSELPILNSIFLGAFIVAVAGIFSSYYLKFYGHTLIESLSEKFNKIKIPIFNINFLSTSLLIWGITWWIINGLFEIYAFAPQNYQGFSLLLFFAFTSLIALGLEKKLQWDKLAWNGYATALSMLGLFFWFIENTSHPFAHFAWLAWPILFGALFSFLRYRFKLHKTNEAFALSNSHQFLNLHLFSLWLAGILFTWEAVWQTKNLIGLSHAWIVCAFAIPSLIILHTSSKLKFWPVSANRNLYCQLGLLPIMIYLLLWCLLASIHNGTPSPLAYIPLVNPLETLQAIVLVSIFFWWKKFGQRIEFTTKNIKKPITDYINKNIIMSIFGGLIFIMLNSILLRTLHHWVSVPYTSDGIMQSSIAQASLSIFWTILGLSAMIVSSRLKWRKLWLCAAALLGVTVAKLFFLDLGDRETLVTIFSFIVVGGLLLVVGYFSPIPPNQSNSQKKESDDNITKENQHKEEQVGK